MNTPSLKMKRVNALLVALLAAGACKPEGGAGPNERPSGPTAAAPLRAAATAAAADPAGAAIVVDAGPPPRGPAPGPIPIPPFTGTAPVRPAADPCGEPNQRCCPGRVCAAGNACVQTRGQKVCLPCGSAGGFCCADGSCGGGACCVRSPTSGVSRCVAVGTGPCGGEGEVCTGTGRCSGPCGSAGQPCCANSTLKWCHAPGTTCLPRGGVDSCAPCGKAGQPCCAAIDGCQAPLTCQTDPATGARACAAP